MERGHLDFEKFKKESLKNPKIRGEYYCLQPEFALVRAILRARREKGLTQKELAERIGSKQAVISRLESGKANPSLGFIKRLAQALDACLEIRLIYSP